MQPGHTGSTYQLLARQVLRRAVTATGIRGRRAALFVFARIQNLLQACPARAACRYQHRWHEGDVRSEEHTSELQSLMRISYAVFCLKKKKTIRIKRNALQHRIKETKQHKHQHLP